jgi:hypothetical protein
MANHFNIPLLWPFKMVPSTDTPGMHFDDDWHSEQIRDWEMKMYYQQKWETADTTKLQIESSIAPETLKVLDRHGAIVKTFTWTAVLTETYYKIYETTFDISDLDEGVYYLHQQVTFGALDWNYVSEPISMKAEWPRTLLFTFSNSFNDQDIAWTANDLEMKFRCEADIQEPDFPRDRAAYVNQTRNITNLSGIPYRTFKLVIGDAPGVAPYVVDILNRIFCCDSIDIEGLAYQSDEGSKWEINRIKGIPTIGASIDIAPEVNKTSQQSSDTTPLAPGIVMAYNIETAFFGPGSLVPVVDIEEQS